VTVREQHAAVAKAEEAAFGEVWLASGVAIELAVPLDHPQGGRHRATPRSFSSKAEVAEERMAPGSWFGVGTVRRRSFRREAATVAKNQPSAQDTNYLHTSISGSRSLAARSPCRRHRTRLCGRSRAA
jgi:hypothetical protein